MCPRLLLYLCLLLLLDVSTVFGGVETPQNVTVRGLNTRYVLHWDWEDPALGNRTATFTAQYLAKFKALKARERDWKPVCTDVPERHCDFTQERIHYYGIYLLRVRARVAAQSSGWVQTSFCPEKDADLGPPSSVKVKPVSEGLEIAITEPLSSKNQSMKDLVQKMSYQIQYWKQSQDSQHAKVLHTSNDVVRLWNLERQTWFCVRVQSRCDFYNKSSVFSDTHCTRTEGQTAFWTPLFSAVLGVFLLPLLMFVVYWMKREFCSRVPFPAYMQQRWPSHRSFPVLLSPEERVCEQLEISRAVMDEQVFTTPSHQSSRDSGVYSSEEHSGPAPTDTLLLELRP